MGEDHDAIYVKDDHGDGDEDEDANDNDADDDSDVVGGSVVAVDSDNFPECYSTHSCVQPLPPITHALTRSKPHSFLTPASLTHLLTHS